MTGPADRMTFEELTAAVGIDPAELDVMVEQRRQDTEFMERLRRHHEEERELYELLGLERDSDSILARGGATRLGPAEFEDRFGHLPTDGEG